ncbi:glutamate--tRNA ligase [Sulfurimonas sp. HSL1-2]|uniref:glutamate--tRNA ligase n=1 Tax=Thiomicrolovo zhangzhouensis TaxID=3131933 RepID=UPI0031F95610
MLRFAPSPTGDMHIGNLRVAIFNALLSRQRNEPLLIRIEDTDKERNIEGKDKEILQILALFGIEYIDVIYQSNNLRFHRAMAIQLLQEKKAFNCFCTPEELDRKRELAKEQKKPFRYDDACTHLPPEATIDNENPFTVRLKRPDAPITVEDIIKGSATFDPADIDSFIILRAEKFPTYNFACAIDDMLGDISLVIRGEDHFSNTSKQIAIRDALGYDKKVEYAHLPIILNDEGKKMSKRDNASSVKWMLEEGFLPEAIANYLILIGNKTPEEVFTMADAVAWFDLKNISRAPARFSIDKLRHINREHLRRMDDKELSRYVGFADDAIGRLAKLYLEEASTTKELKSKVAAVFAPKEIPDEFAESAEAIRAAIKAAPYFEAFDDLKQHVVDTTGIKGKQLFKSLRLLLTGAEHGPELADVYTEIKSYLGEIVK